MRTRNDLRPRARNSALARSRRLIGGPDISRNKCCGCDLGKTAAFSLLSIRNSATDVAIEIQLHRHPRQVASWFLQLLRPATHHFCDTKYLPAPTYRQGAHYARLAERPRHAVYRRD